MNDEPEGPAWKRSWTNRDGILAFMWGGGGLRKDKKLRKISFPAEIRTENFPRTSLEPYL
jgi:hypothetical protein